MPARILLVRHGPSSHVHDGAWLSRVLVSRFEDAYDAAGIEADCVLPEEGLRLAADD